MNATMAPPARALLLWLDDRRVGALGERDGLWSFTYEADWIEAENGFDLAPDLPRQHDPLLDGGTRRPVQWFFDNLLPEESARDLQARELKVDRADAFALLSALGAESAGPWTLLPPDARPAAPGLQALSHEVLSRRIEAMPQVSLQKEAPKLMSMAGAQHKLAISVRDGEWFEPVGSEASTHLLKPDHPHAEHWWHTAFNEYLCMRLAVAAGLAVPEVAFYRVPQPVYLVQRFDRDIGDDGKVTRLPVIDACQLLGLDRQFKYTQATPDTLCQLADRCARPAATRQALLRWSIFNLLIGNSDAHLKNLSFLTGPQGIRLAPFYDLLSTAVYHKGEPFDRPDWSNDSVSLPFGSLRTFGDLERRHLGELARATRLSPAAAERDADRMIEWIRDALPSIEADWPSTPEDRRPDAGEQALFRAISAGLFAEQSGRLDD